MKTIGFIGAGTVGKALAWGLTRAPRQGTNPGPGEAPQGAMGLRWPVVAVASRSRGSAAALAARIPGCQVCDRPQEVADRADLVFITTPDDAITPVAEAVAWHPGQGVVHCSGADSAAILEPARQDGALTGVMHPLLPIASAEPALGFRGATFALEGESALLFALQRMAEALGGRWIVLRPEEKVLYHAAAVLASNYLVTLAKLATDLWGRFAVDRETALQALVPLLLGTVRNLAEEGLPNGLTGPIARGDSGTVRKHLLALAERAPELRAIYRELGLQTLPIALEKGRLSLEQAAELRELFAGQEQSPSLPAYPGEERTTPSRR